jgi:hypothetical protein
MVAFKYLYNARTVRLLPLVLFEVRSIDIDEKPLSLHQQGQQL